jgi:adenine-specific DNA-methyltransferase
VPPTARTNRAAHAACTDLTTVERERQREQARLDAERSPRARNRAGQFATPPDLAAELARYVVPLLGDHLIRFLDPAVGSGAFFSAFCSRLGPERITKATGVELDPQLARLARRLWGGHGLQVRRADFTRLRPPPRSERFNLVVANPPYVRHHHLPPPEKHRLRAAVSQRAGLGVSGLAGLYCHFLLLADEWLVDGGLGVWLLPSEFLDVNYGQVLREYLSRRVQLLRIHRFHPRDLQFSDALVTSTIVVFRKGPPKKNCTLTSGGTPRHPRRSKRVAMQTLADTPKWSPLLEPQAPKSPTRTRTLGELFTVRRGIATGANHFFVRDRREALASGIPPDSLRPLLPSPKDLDTDVVTSGTDGWPTLASQRALLDVRWPPGVVRTHHRALWRILEMGRNAGLDRRYLTSRRQPWYAQERRQPPLFLCTYMGRGADASGPFRFVWNRSLAVATNVYLLLQPKPGLERVLESFPEAQANVHAGLRAIGPASLVAGGRVYGGGLHKLEPRELATIDAHPVLERLPVSIEWDEVE